MITRLFLLSLIFVSCSGRKHDCRLDDYQWDVIEGRGDTFCLETPEPIYRAQRPTAWKGVNVERSSDTRLPICAYRIADEAGEVDVVIHTFPFKDGYEGVPPKAQVSRWESQFNDLHGDVAITPSIQEGYTGLRFQALGKENGVLAWSYQLAPELSRHLAFPRTEKESATSPDMRADVTIKATGAPELLAKHKKEIAHFAESFALITSV